MSHYWIIIILGLDSAYEQKRDIGLFDEKNIYSCLVHYSFIFIGFLLYLFNKILEEVY
jgi:hypothetical protein